MLKYFANFQVKETLSWLQSKGIYSRGRCGAFSQKVQGIEDDFIQGVEVVDHILHGCPEHCLNSGDSPVVDSSKFCMPKYHLKRESISTASSKYEDLYDSETSSSSDSSSSDSSSSLYSDSDEGEITRSYTTTDSGLDSRED